MCGAAGEVSGRASRKGRFNPRDDGGSTSQVGAPDVSHVYRPAHGQPQEQVMSGEINWYYFRKG